MNDGDSYFDGWKFAATGRHESSPRDDEAFERGRAAGLAALKEIEGRPKAYVEGWKDAVFGMFDHGRAGRREHHAGDPDYTAGVDAGESAHKLAERDARDDRHE